MAEYRYDVACEDCLHNGVCCVQEHCVDVKQYIQTFGCCDFKAAADVVEVVRCKNCRHCERGVCYHPEQRYLIVYADHYCGYGENRYGKMDGKGENA